MASHQCLKSPLLPKATFEFLFDYKTPVFGIVSLCCQKSNGINSRCKRPPTDKAFLAQRWSFHQWLSVRMAKKKQRKMILILIILDLIHSFQIFNPVGSTVCSSMIKKKIDLWVLVKIVVCVTMKLPSALRNWARDPTSQQGNEEFRAESRVAKSPLM